MTLITSQIPKRKEPRMADKTAKEDIVVTNSLGQRVVLVAAGQPIPEDIDERKAQVEAKAVEEPTENKARSRASKK